MTLKKTVVQGILSMGTFVRYRGCRWGRGWLAPFLRRPAQEPFRRVDGDNEGSDMPIRNDSMRSSAAWFGDISRRSLVRGLAGAGLAAGFGQVLRFAPVAAQESTPMAALPPAHRVQVGQIAVLVLEDAVFPGPPALFALNAPEAELTAELAEQGLAPDATIDVSVHPLLVETDGQRILLDTGLGAQGNLLNALAAEGIAPGDIDIVLLTHMHFDHFGGALDANGAPVFPNARYLINGAEREFWAAGPSLEELAVPAEQNDQSRQGALDALAAMDGFLEEIAPGDEIAPGVTVIDAKGHTPGHLVVEMTSGDETMLHLVDAVHVPFLHLEHPDWFMLADNWPAWSITNRKLLLDRAADENLLVATYHFPFPGVGRVTKDEVGWIWTDEG